MKIGIVGVGFVGQAVDYGFSVDVEKFLVDPKLGTTLMDLRAFDPEYIFICVPTPMGDNGAQDSTILVDAVEQINRLFNNAIIIIKSTVLPNILQTLSTLYPWIVYNPEFLREKSAHNDFINATSLILGGEKPLTAKISDLYKKHTLCKIEHIFETDLISASLVKYSINTFLASKVIFFNQLKNIFDASGTEENWGAFVEIVSSDDRIGNSHMDVPGHDGRMGFGGACFPKDTAALLRFSQDLEIEFSLLKQAIKINNSIRESYLALDDREKEQSVNFNIEL